MKRFKKNIATLVAVTFIFTSALIMVNTIRDTNTSIDSSGSGEQLNPEGEWPVRK